MTFHDIDPLSEAEMDLLAYAEVPGVSTPTRQATQLVMDEYYRLRSALAAVERIGEGEPLAEWEQEAMAEEQQ